jgi:uncharacterized damage-inducible protein DinB
LDAAAGLTPGELTRDFATADKSILGTLKHVYGADWAWVERLHGNSPAAYPAEGPTTLEALTTDWPRLYTRWRETLATEDPNREVAYKTFKGDAYRSPVWQIVLHVVNHGSHHRGQVAGFLRSMGKTPPVLDLMMFYRQRNS